jgi:hypothetical protein
MLAVLMRERFERYFEFAELGTNWQTEILAGVTTEEPWEGMGGHSQS